MANPTLTLEVIQATPITVKFQTKELKLGDGYEQVAGIGKKGMLTDYGITSGYLSIVDSMSVVNQLINWRGVQAFLWSPKAEVLPKLFVCSSWQVKLETGGKRQITCTFQEVVK